jgi:predicted alpha/beta-hydrolase family hydrolase
MKGLAKALNDVGIATLRYEFAYREQGKKRPDPPMVAAARVAEAVQLAVKKKPRMKIFAGGKSFGGRMTTTAAALGKIKVAGIICFSFPLHPAKQPSVARAEHLKDVKIPMLWIQGTRDDLADPKLTRRVAKKNRISLNVIEGADHGYKVLKSSGRTHSDVLREVAGAVREFIERSR